jgi:hypothetical protein
MSEFQQSIVDTLQDGDGIDLDFTFNVSPTYMQSVMFVHVYKQNDPSEYFHVATLTIDSKKEESYV